MNNSLIYNESNLDDITDEIFSNDSILSEYMEEFVAKVFVMGTGMGKTHNCWNTLLEDLINKGVRTFLYYAPATELLDRSQPVEALKAMGIDADQFQVLTSSNDCFKTVDKLKAQMGNKIITILLSTDQFFQSQSMNKNEGFRRKQYINFFKSLGKKFALFRDEIHHGGASDVDSAEIKNGVRKEDYIGRVAEFQDSFLNSKSTPYVFCATATPFDELTNPNVGSNNWQIVNNTIEPSRVVASQAHMRPVEWHNYDYTNEEEIRSLLQEKINHVCNDSMIRRKMLPWTGTSNLEQFQIQSMLKELSLKRTMMIKCQQFSAKKDSKVDAAYILKVLASGIVPKNVQYCLVYSGSDHSTITDQKKGWAVRDYRGQIVKQGPKGDPYLKWLRDPEDPLRILITINKGGVGVDVGNLHTLVAFRASKVSNDDGLITDSQIQLIGRFQRRNIGGLSLDQIKKLEPRLQYIIFEELNQFQLVVPDEPSWKKTIDRWVSNEGTSVYDTYKHRVA